MKRISLLSVSLLAIGIVGWGQRLLGALDVSQLKACVFKGHEYASPAFGAVAFDAVLPAIYDIFAAEGAESLTEEQKTALKSEPMRVLVAALFYRGNDPHQTFYPMQSIFSLGGWLTPAEAGDLAGLLEVDVPAPEFTTAIEGIVAGLVRRAKGNIHDVPFVAEGLARLHAAIREEEATLSGYYKQLDDTKAFVAARCQEQEVVLLKKGRQVKISLPVIDEAQRPAIIQELSKIGFSSREAEFKREEINDRIKHLKNEAAAKLERLKEELASFKRQHSFRDSEVKYFVAALSQIKYTQPVYIPLAQLMCGAFAWQKANRKEDLLEYVLAYGRRLGATGSVRDGLLRDLVRDKAQARADWVGASFSESELRAGFEAIADANKQGDMPNLMHNPALSIAVWFKWIGARASSVFPPFVRQANDVCARQDCLSFPDCGEATLLNFFNILLWDAQLKRLDLGRLQIIFGPEPTGLAARLCDFYREFPDITEHFKGPARNAWAALIANIDGIEYSREHFGFRYSLTVPNNRSSDGLENFQRAAAAIAGMPFADILKHLPAGFRYANIDDPVIMEVEEELGDGESAFYIIATLQEEFVRIRAFDHKHFDTSLLRPAGEEVHLAVGSEALQQLESNRDTHLPCFLFALFSDPDNPSIPWMLARRLAQESFDAASSFMTVTAAFAASKLAGWGQDGAQMMSSLAWFLLFSLRQEAASADAQRVGQRVIDAFDLLKQQEPVGTNVIAVLQCLGFKRQGELDKVHFNDFLSTMVSCIELENGGACTTLLCCLADLAGLEGWPDICREREDLCRRFLNDIVTRLAGPEEAMFSHVADGFIPRGLLGVGLVGWGHILPVLFRAAARVQFLQEVFQQGLQRFLKTLSRMACAASGYHQKSFVDFAFFSSDIACDELPVTVTFLQAGCQNAAWECLARVLSDMVPTMAIERAPYYLLVALAAELREVAVEIMARFPQSFASFMRVINDLMALQVRVEQYPETCQEEAVSLIKRVEGLEEIFTATVLLKGFEAFGAVRRSQRERAQFFATLTALAEQSEEWRTAIKRGLQEIVRTAPTGLLWAYKADLTRLIKTIGSDGMIRALKGRTAQEGQSQRYDTTFWDRLIEDPPGVGAGGR